MLRQEALTSALCLQHSRAKVLEKTFEGWMRYRDECLEKIANDPYPTGEAGIGAVTNP